MSTIFSRRRSLLFIVAVCIALPGAARLSASTINPDGPAGWESTGPSLDSVLLSETNVPLRSFSLLQFSGPIFQPMGDDDGGGGGGGAGGDDGGGAGGDEGGGDAGGGDAGGGGGDAGGGQEDGGAGATVPEPSSLLILLSGLATLGMVRVWRRRTG